MRCEMFKRVLVLTITMLFFLAVLSNCKSTTEPDAVATPTFNPPGSTYTTAQSVTISCTTSDATIRYTIDGSDPSSNSTVYSSPISVSTSTTLKARADKSGWTNSNIATATYTISPTQSVETPSFNPPAGSYTTAQSVTLSCATSGATIRYTTNGSEPTELSTLYNNPISVNATTTVKAKAYNSDWTPSAIASATYTINIQPSQMVYVPGGTFMMGDTNAVGFTDALPNHYATVNSFYLSKYEVTQSEWIAAVTGISPNGSYGAGANYPVYGISWYAALKYCNLRSISEGLAPVYTISSSTDPASWGAVPTENNTIWNAVVCNWNANGYRLPTEAEWEYAARGGTDTPDYLYSGSNSVNDVAWNFGNTSGTSHSVGSKAANGLGIYDMSGNVMEWCWDWYTSDYYSSSPQVNPAGPSYGFIVGPINIKVLRGGYWGGFSCNVAERWYAYTNYTDYFQGFRVCRSGL